MFDFRIIVEIAMNKKLSMLETSLKPSTYKTKPKRVQSKEKHALSIIFNQSKTSPNEPLFLNLPLKKRKRNWQLFTVQTKR